MPHPRNRATEWRLSSATRARSKYTHHVPTSPRPIKRIGRKRRVLGWTLLTLGVFAAGLWFASGFVWYGWRCIGPLELSNTRYTLSLSAGAGNLDVGLQTPPLAPPQFRQVAGRPRTPLTGWSVEWTPDRWWSISTVTYGFVTRTSWWLAVPLWLVCLPLALAGVLLVRSGNTARRRALTGYCKACGYDLSGLGAEAKCPECGRELATT